MLDRPWSRGSGKKNCSLQKKQTVNRDEGECRKTSRPTFLSCRWNFPPEKSRPYKDLQGQPSIMAFVDKKESGLKTIAKGFVCDLAYPAEPGFGADVAERSSNAV